MLLLREWDPLGLAGCDGANNHYDVYAMRVFEMFQDGENEAAIARYLYSVVTSELGLKGNINRDQTIATRAVFLCKS